MTAEREAIVVGAGLAGLACARELSQAGWQVVVLEQAANPGGRLAGCQVEGHWFDAGATHFTVDDPLLQAALADWLDHGVVAPWPAVTGRIQNRRFEAGDPWGPLYVGVPNQRALADHLAVGLAIRYQTPVAGCRCEAGRWQVSGPGGESLASAATLVLATPAPVAARLLPPDDSLVAAASAVEMHACHAVAVGFDEPLPLDFDAAFVGRSDLIWVARDSRKPGRDPLPDRWVLQSMPTPAADGIAPAGDLIEAFFLALGLPRIEASLVGSHTWTHAVPINPLPDGYLMDRQRRLACCGDWCGGPRSELAWLSGHLAARELLDDAD